MKVKTENPETFQVAINTIAKDKEEKIIVLGLEEIIEILPNMTNNFYAYDCDFKALRDANVKKYICVSKVLAYDNANILVYAGESKDKITIIPTDDDKEMLAELMKYDINNIYLVADIIKYDKVKKCVEDQNGK